MSRPFISVILPVYNAEKFIKEAIESILRQTYSNFELIIINDGSTDKSKEIILSTCDPRIRYFENEKNSGSSFSRNKGIEIAQGEFIAIIDSDDIALPNRFEVQVNYLLNNPEIGLCATEMSTIDENNRIINEKIYGTLTLPIEWLLIWKNPIANSSVLFRKGILADNNLFYNHGYCPAEDYELWTKMILHTKMGYINKVLLHYRIYPESLYHSNQNKAFDNSIRASSNLAFALSKKNVPEFHQIFTDFYSNDLTKSIYNYFDIKNWFNLLFKIAFKKWGWDKATKKSVWNDVNIRLKKYKEYIIIPYINKQYMVSGTYNFSLLKSFYFSGFQLYRFINIYRQLKFVLKCLAGFKKYRR